MAKVTVTTSPFEYVNAINRGSNLIKEDSNPSEREEQYLPFITNKAFSNHKDTILQANQMNMYNRLDKLLQFEYLLHTIRPRKRAGIWNKADKQPDYIRKLAEYYKINIHEAAKYAAIMSNEEIKEKIDMGGKDE